MATSMAKLLKWLKGVWKGTVIADVPPNLAQCEFGCRVRECSHGKWQSCENRIRCMNAEIAHTQRQHEGGKDLESRPSK
jgi:hypothetical protein